MSAYSITTRGLPQGVLATMGDLLFAASEPGAWYDPSDMSTLFQDSAGTVPVTAVEQPVGRILDKSGRGNHATQATTTKRPMLSRRVNLLLASEAFNTSAWTAGKTPGASVVADTTVAPNGTLTADTVTFAASSDYLYQPILGFNTTAGEQITLEYKSRVTGRIITFGGASPAGTDVFSYLDIGGGWYKHTITRTFTATTTGTLQIIPSGVVVGAGSYALWGASLTLSTDAHLPYQWVNTATDYDADPAKYPAYLRFDGVDDALQTGNIDFTSTDKMTVWAGVTKLSDAVRMPLAEFAGYGQIGGFGMYASPQGVSNQIQVYSAGTTAVHSYATGAPPNTTFVQTLVAAISAPSLVQRKNGVMASASSASQGVGNYANAALSIGGGVTLSNYLNGRLYSLIVRGAQSSLSQIEAAERYIKQKMRLP